MIVLKPTRTHIHAYTTSLGLRARPRFVKTIVQNVAYFTHPRLAVEQSTVLHINIGKEGQTH